MPSTAASACSTSLSTSFPVLASGTAHHASADSTNERPRHTYRPQVIKAFGLPFFCGYQAHANGEALVSRKKSGAATLGAVFDVDVVESCDEKGHKYSFGSKRMQAMLFFFPVYYLILPGFFSEVPAFSVTCDQDTRAFAVALVLFSSCLQPPFPFLRVSTSIRVVNHSSGLRSS